MNDFSALSINGRVMSEFPLGRLIYIPSSES